MKVPCRSSPLERAMEPSSIEVPRLTRILRVDAGASLMLAGPVSVFAVAAVTLPLALLWFHFFRPQVLEAFSWIGLGKVVLKDPVSVFLVVFVFGVLPLGALRRALYLQRFLRRGRWLEARVSEVRHRGPSWSIDVEYDLDGAILEKRFNLSGPKQTAAFAVGQKAAVVVDPNDPSRCELAELLLREAREGATDEQRRH